MNLWIIETWNNINKNELAGKMNLSIINDNDNNKYDMMTKIRVIAMELINVSMLSVHTKDSWVQDFHISH